MSAVHAVMFGPGIWFRAPKHFPIPLCINGHAYRRRTRRRKP